VRRVGFVLPGQATVTVAVGPDTEQGQRIDVRFAGALVVWPSSASETVTSAGLPKARTLGYSRNPVWCVCDLITDPHVGGGSFFDWNDIDIPSAYAAAAFCDEAVTLRDGTEQTRSLCDYVVGEGGERRSLGEWIAAMLAGSGVFAYWRSGKWFFVADEDSAVAIDPDTSSDFEIVEEEDCPAGSCELSYAGSEEIPSDLVVQFRDGENLDAESQEPIVFDDPQPTPRITERVEFPAVRRRTQAHWSGGILLRQMALARRSVRCLGTIGRGLRLLRLDPGDIVRFTSARLGLAAVKMRVMAVGWTSGMRPALDLVEHVSAAYTDSFAGPNSGVTPGQRAPSDSETPVPTQISVRHVSGHRALRTAGGAA